MGNKSEVFQFMGILLAFNKMLLFAFNNNFIVFNHTTIVLKIHTLFTRKSLLQLNVFLVKYRDSIRTDRIQTVWRDYLILTIKFSIT